MTTDIVGTIALNPTDDRLLIFNIDPDTLPQNTLDPVDSVINPFTKYPGNGLPDSEDGQRYLIVDNLGGNAGDSPWGSVVANANDIIQYVGNQWVKVFDARSTTKTEYVTNLTTSVQYQYRLESTSWLKSYEGWYEAGDFSVVI
jgi:hypothetical protein